jgi:hypothetical protein
MFSITYRHHTLEFRSNSVQFRRTVFAPSPNSTHASRCCLPRPRSPSVADSVGPADHPRRRSNTFSPALRPPPDRLATFGHHQLLHRPRQRLERWPGHQPCVVVCPIPPFLPLSGQNSSTRTSPDAQIPGSPSLHSTWRNLRARLRNRWSSANST